jgi:hypothetical protein
MPALRAIRLLNAVENGTVTGAQLQTTLSDGGRLGEFKVLLTMRGTTRRIASNATTMTAILGSSAAINTIFAQATAENSTACKAIISVPSAMALVTLNIESLQAAESSVTAWNLLTTNENYEANSKNAIATLAGLVAANYATINALVADPVAKSIVIASRRATRAVIASLPSVGVVAANATMMAEVANNPAAIRLFAVDRDAFPYIAASTTAMSAIAPILDAMTAIANSKVAIDAVYTNPAAWAAYKGSTHFIASVPATAATLAGLVPALYPTLISMVNDPAALVKVLANGGASEAMATNSATMLALATNPNFFIVLGNATVTNAIASNSDAIIALVGNSGNLTAALASPAMVAAISGNSAALVNLATSANFSVIAGNATVMSAFANNIAAVGALADHANFTVATNNNVAIGAITSGQAAMTRLLGSGATDANRAAMFSSANARAAMFVSNVATNTMAATAATVTWLRTTSGRAIVTTGTTVPNGIGRVGAFDPYGGGVPSKILMLAATQIGIAAIPTSFQFATASAGSQGGAELSLVGVAALAPDQNPYPHFAMYQDLTVKTAAAVIAITGVSRIVYVSMM